MDADQTPSTENPGWYKEFLNPDGTILDDKVSCDSKVCGEEGTYYVTKTCCNGVVIHCRTCFTSLFHHLVKTEQAGYTYTCGECGVKNYPTKVFNKVKNIRLGA